MNTMETVLDTTRFVMENSKHVSIDREKISEFCVDFDLGSTKHWLRESPFDLSLLDEVGRANFLFVFNSINFCYWGEPKWTVEHRGEMADGAWGMITAFGRAIESESPIVDADFLASLSEESLRHIFRGNVTIPLFAERLAILREVGAILCDRYEGRFTNFIEKAGGDAMELVRLVVENFPSYEDVSPYDGRNVVFRKRAQLLVSDTYHVFEGNGPGQFSNIHRLTAFADYKIPQVLRKHGILRYMDELAEKVDGMIFIPKNSGEEVEIRANTIWAVELIREVLDRRSPGITSALVNDMLWLAGHDKSPLDKPYHRTRTISY